MNTVAPELADGRWPIETCASDNCRAPIVWAVTGDARRATRVASYVGQAVAFAIIGWGVFRVYGGDVFSGLWLVYIGWFLNGGAVVFNINYAGGDGNDVVLTVAVPEPGTAGLLLAATAPLLGLRRFRRRRA